MKRFTILALALAIGLAVALAPLASKQPDGLNRVAADHGFADRATTESHYGSSPLTIGLAGLAGTLIVFAAGIGVVKAARRP
jgi:cobalt/nickel transport protein